MHIHTYAYINIHTYIQIYAYTHKSEATNPSSGSKTFNTYIHTYMHKHTHIFVDKCTYIHTNLCAYSQIRGHQTIIRVQNIRSVHYKLARAYTRQQDPRDPAKGRISPLFLVYVWVCVCVCSFVCVYMCLVACLSVCMFMFMYARMCVVYVCV
jgi:hypothetical protein